MYSSAPPSDATMLLCRDCGVLHPLPAQQPTPEADDVDDLESFRSAHQAHQLERAYRLPNPILHDRPAWDPMARTWFRVAVGEHSLFVCSSRTSIDEPRQHEICSSPPTYSTYAEIDESMLRRALDQYFFPNNLAAEKLNAFVTAARELYASVEAEGVETSFDDADAANAEIGHCPLEICTRLRATAVSVFSDAWEREHVLDFIDANTDEYGALAIRVMREIKSVA